MYKIVVKNSFPLLSLFIIPLVVTSEVNDVRNDSISNENKESTNVTSNSKIRTADKSNFECEAPWRLPRNILPTNYEITLRIDPDDTVFNGSVVIDLQCVQKTKEISLHMKNLTINGDLLFHTEKHEIVPIPNITFDDQHELVHLKLESPLEKGNYVLNISSFVGIIRDENIGLFRRTYKSMENVTSTNNSSKLVASQLGGTYARMVFPCFDEPDMKATFTVHIERPSYYESFSSMPLNTSTLRPHGRVLDTFEKSFMLPTYTLGFLVGKYSRYPENDVGRTHILVPEEDLDKVGSAYHFAVSALEQLESYTKMPYTTSKMDHGAVPNFNVEAMENWGLILYEKTKIVVDWKTHSNLKQNGMTLITHELAHQWFGNIVTCNWWSYLWLNEAFATYFQYFITNKISPEWRLWDQFLIYVFQKALTADAKTTKPSSPMTSRRCSPEEIEDMYNDVFIFYEKGASILRMFQSILGEDEFQAALRIYLHSRAMKNARPADLFQVFDEICAKLNQNPLPTNVNVTFTDLGKGWTEQAGFPVITVSRDYTSSSVLVRQERYFDQRAKEFPMKNDSTRWWIPLTWTYGSAPRRRPGSGPQDWLYADKTVRVYAKPGDWLLFNTNAEGFYRVNYDKQNWDLLRQQLERHLDAFSVPNRIQLLNDAFSLGFAHRLNLGTALNLTRYLREEEDPVVWISAGKQFDLLYGLMASTSAYPNLENYLQKLMRSIYRRVRLDVTAEEPHINKILRGSLAPTACAFGLDLCLIDAQFELSQFLAKAKLKGEKSAVETFHPDIQWTVLSGGIQSGGRSVFEEVRSLAFNTTTETAMKQLYRNSLSYSKDFDLLTWHLDDIFDNNNALKDVEAAEAVKSVLQNQRSFYTGFQFVKNNVNKINHYYNCSTTYTEALVKEISNNIRTNNFYHEVRQWIVSSNGDELGNKTKLLLYLQSKRSEIKWSSESVQQVSDWLDTTQTTLPEPMAAGSLGISAVVSLTLIIFSLMLNIKTTF